MSLTRLFSPPAGEMATQPPHIRPRLYLTLLAALLSPSAQALDENAIAQRIHQKADQLSQGELLPLQQAYRAAVERFDGATGPEHLSDALNLLQYLGYQDSQASALRLCATLGLGIKVKVEHLLASYWCLIASRRTPEALLVVSYIEEQFYLDPSNTLPDEP